MRWQPEDLTCAECQFDWSTQPATVIAAVEKVPFTIEGETERARWLESDSAERWTPSEYLWHLVDVLRIGTERLWLATYDTTTRIFCWDQDGLAKLRKYSELSPVVGAVALEEARRGWAAAARSAPPSVELVDDASGPMPVANVIRHTGHEVIHHRLDIDRALRRRA